MSNYLKKALQRVLVQRRHRSYEERIAGQAVPYGVWLEKLLEEERAGILQWKERADRAGTERLSTAVLSWQEFAEFAMEAGEASRREQKSAGFGGRALASPGASESALIQGTYKERADLWIVTPDASCLADEAEAEAERYFSEHPACGIAYGDEDGYFKPGWSPDLLLSFFYFGNVFAVRRELAEQAGEKILLSTEGTRMRGTESGTAGAGADGAESGTAGAGAGGTESGTDITAVSGADDELWLKKLLYEIVLCCIDEAGEAGHIEKVLFLPKHDPERCFESDWGMEAEFDGVKRGHLYSDAEIPGEKERQGLVSVIIPSKDNPAVLSNCIHSLREQTDYKNIEIIVIDNGSSEKNKNRVLRIRDQLKEEYSFRYIYQPMEFNFSAMCNLGAKEAKGKYLLFLNDDMEIVREDWLRLMVSKAAKHYVGAVGVKLLYPDSDKIQHLGITNIHLGPAHKLQFLSDREAHYHGINRCAVNVSAVTGACLLVRKEVFEKVSGFEERLQVAFNDVELCFHLLKAGYQNVCCNHTFLYHHESLSRGFDAGQEKVARLHRERDLLYKTYPEMWNRDAYYSKRLVTDILDRGFEPACRFEEKRLSKRAEVLRIDGELNPVWHNECLYMGLEFTGDESAWRTGKSGGGDYYIQGWSYAVNVDNSRYEKSLLLKPMSSGTEPGMEEKGMWKIPYEECYRPDIEENLPYIDHPGLCGVSVWIPRDALPAGEYLIGYFWEDACSRQKLYGFSAETIAIGCKW